MSLKKVTNVFGGQVVAALEEPCLAISTVLRPPRKIPWQPTSGIKLAAGHVLEDGCLRPGGYAECNEQDRDGGRDTDQAANRNTAEPTHS